MADNEQTVGETVPRHPIRVVADRSGLSPHIIRMWERRYGVVSPSRGTNGYRQYSDADIDRLRGLRELTRSGHGISDLAKLDTNALGRMLDRNRALHGPAPVEDWGSVAASDGDEESASLVPSVFRARLDSAVEEWDADLIASALKEAALRLPLDQFLDAIVGDLLRTIGEAWARGDVGPAREHMVTAVMPRTLGWVAERIPAAAPDAPLALISTPAGVRHDLGALIAEVVIRSEGWRALFLGADLPAEEIASAALRNGADVIALSIVYPFDDDGVRAELRALSRGPASVLPLIVGGRAAPSYADVIPEDSLVTGSVAEIRQRLREWRARL